MENVVEVSHLTKRYCAMEKPFTALNDVSFTIAKGEFVAIMGASGSGKSTLLHVLAGLTPFDQGHIMLDGDTIQDCTDRQLTLMRRRKLGFIFQSFNLIPTLNVRENILLPLRADHHKICETKLHAVTDMLGITDKLDRYAHTLSGGEQQRVAIARSLLIDPCLILADEPTGSLDSIAGEKLCQVLQKNCKEKGQTLLLVTHEPHVALYADRILILKDGVIIHTLNTADFNEPQDLALAYNHILSTAQTEC